MWSRNGRRVRIVEGALGLLLAVLPGAGALSVHAADPFDVSCRATGTTALVTVSVPAGYHIYADQMEAVAGPGALGLKLVGGDHPVRLHDAFSDSVRESYTSSFTVAYAVPAGLPAGSALSFSYQGCSEKECFFPATRKFALAEQPEDVNLAVHTSVASGRWNIPAETHRISGRAAGYLDVADFIRFLDRSEGKAGDPSRGSAGGWSSRLLLFNDDPVLFMERYGFIWTFLLILIGGLLLNLTPCVLPMIPINLAILGIGSQDSSRVRGLLVGACYGVGIALVYGVLGLVVVLTGAQFGALNSMPGFNLVMGVVFIVLGLAMFDVISIDLTRFQSGAGGGAVSTRGGLLPAVIMGGVAALLAGACVAPVVIAVLLLSGSLYAHGAAIGLVLPFVLGLGMALPWPLAGAGLTFLPKPGRWMSWVKYGFGVFILIIALYYISLAYRGWHGAAPGPQATAGGDVLTVADAAKWDGILKASAADGKPIFVDFWATWCKNCEAMELTTFKENVVKARLSNYRVVKIQVENLAQPEAREVAGAFEVKGLPTYIVVQPSGKR